MPKFIKAYVRYVDAVNRGLGYLVIYSLSSLRTDRMLAVVVVIALLGYALDKAVVLARDRLIYWEKLDTYYV